MGGNDLQSLKKLMEFVAKMKQLTKLDISGNKVCDTKDYREKVLAAMKKNVPDAKERIVLDGRYENGISATCSYYEEE
jgi:hypothetical protein